MKKVVIFLTFLLAGVSSVYAQNGDLTKFFDKYADNDDFTKIVVTGRMFSLMADVAADDEDAQELLSAASGIEGLKVLQSDKVDGIKMYKDLYGKLTSSGYEELMSISEGNEQEIKFVIKEKDKLITEMVMISGGESEFALIYLYGNIDLQKIVKLAKKMDIDGLDPLQKLDDEGN